MVGAAATLEDPAAAEARAAEEPSAPASGRLPPRLPRGRAAAEAAAQGRGLHVVVVKSEAADAPAHVRKGSSERWSSSLFFGVDHVFFAGCLFERGRSASVDSDRLLRTASAGSACCASCCACGACSRCSWLAYRAYRIIMHRSGDYFNIYRSGIIHQGSPAATIGRKKF